MRFANSSKVLAKHRASSKRTISEHKSIFRGALFSEVHVSFTPESNPVSDLHSIRMKLQIHLQKQLDFLAKGCSVLLDLKKRADFSVNVSKCTSSVIKIWLNNRQINCLLMFDYQVYSKESILHGRFSKNVIRCTCAAKPLLIPSVTCFHVHRTI